MPNNPVKVPKNIMVSAVAATRERFPGDPDCWGTAEERYCKEMCGPEYAHINESDFRRMAINLRIGLWVE